jgi:nucleotide-binding universal stress UspA family protein
LLSVDEDAGFPAPGEMPEIRRILCPVDLSDVSRRALHHAVLLARWYQARITALHVWNPMVILSSDLTLIGPARPVVYTEEEINEVRRQVTGFAAGAGAADAEVLVLNGQPPAQILERAGALPADLIVIGTHGAGGFQHLVLGSVTEKVLRQATCPVLTVPPHARATSQVPFRHVLCPVDFSESSIAALDFAFSLAQEGDASLTILHVCEWPAEGDPLVTRSFNVPEYLQAREHDAQSSLEALVPDSTRDWCRPTTRIVHGKPYREILGIATEDSADLIVMGVHGRKALELMLFGSTTNQVVRRATCPVLTLRQ